jgi:hypothetical protein
MMSAFRRDLSEAATALPHFWEHMVGSDHAPVALRADWQAQLRRCHSLYYTEWNASSNPRDPLRDEPYAVAAITIKFTTDTGGGARA